jgi:Glycosyl transferase family 2
MKLWAVSMVRNEADVVEAFVRHNLAFLDGIAVLDHASIDGTFEVLSRLRAEGLPLALLRSAEPGFFQGSQVSALARECFARTGADFVFALDADEFLRAASRAAIEQALAALPRGSHALHAWRTYVPSAFDLPFGPHCVQYRLRREIKTRRKVIIGRSFAEQPQAMVSEGNHWIADPASGRTAALEPIPAEAITLAHCPVRGRRQLEAKVRLGYAALLAAGGTQATAGFHWRDLHDDLLRGIPLSDARLRLVAANYGLPRQDWVPEEAIELVSDPVVLRFAGAGPSPARNA